MQYKAFKREGAGGGGYYGVLFLYGNFSFCSHVKNRFVSPKTVLFRTIRSPGTAQLSRLVNPTKNKHQQQTSKTKQNRTKQRVRALSPCLLLRCRYRSRCTHHPRLLPAYYCCQVWRRPSSKTAPNHAFVSFAGPSTIRAGWTWKSCALSRWARRRGC